MSRGRFWLVSAAAAAGVAATLALGFWQLSRAAQKEALQAGIEARSHLPVLDGAALARLPAQALQDRTVQLRGQWLAQHTVFLDNRQMQGHPGFYVVTPLALQGPGQGTVVLVQRGWAPRNFLDRTRLPQVATPGGTVEVAGRMAPPPGKLYDFKGGRGGAIRQNLDLADFSAETRLSLLGLSVVQAGAASDGLLRDWPQVDSGVGKHYGYAFQWFALSGLMAVLYVWFQFIAPRRTQRPA